ncbi:MAG: response regulator transcription factor [Anaerolineales bacterium]|nr:response regulator transcription factor [Anaerolineales bacterium]
MDQTGKPKRGKLLLVEDDERIAEPLIFGLEAAGYQVLHSGDGKEGLSLALSAEPSLILLDVMLPGMDGFEICRNLRSVSSVPIIILTAKGQEMEKVMGLELGADDYIVKPFSFRELLARVTAVLRRRELDLGTRSTSSRLRAGVITIDQASRRVFRDEQEIDVTQREFELLHVLMANAENALSRQNLLDAVWGEEWIGDSRTLDVHIRWLREKVEEDPSTPQYIETVRGYGYRFAKSLQ